MDRSDSRALSLYAQLLGRRFNIKIRWATNVGTAATDSREIVIDQRYQRVGSDKEAALLFGLVGHEAMHLRKTDFALATAQLTAWQSAGHNVALLRQLWNAHEDMWGEREFVTIYPGVWTDILASMRAMRELGLYGPAPQGKATPHPATLFCNWYLAEHLALHYWQLPEFASDATTWRAEATHSLGPVLIAEVLQFVPRIREVSSTRDALEQAFTVYRFIEQAAEQQPSQSHAPAKKSDKGSSAPSEPQNGPGAQNSGEGHAPQPEEKPGTEHDGNTGTPNQQTPKNPGNETTTPGGDGGKTEGQNRESAGPTDANRKNAQDVLNAKESDVPSLERGDALRLGEKHGTIRTRSSPYSGAGLDILGGTQSSGLRPSVAQLAREIERSAAGRLDDLLSAYTQQWRDVTDRGRVIDTSLLTRVRTGSRRVFETLEVSQELDTAVMLFMDASTSMSDIWDETIAATWGVGNVLSKHEVPFSIFSFGGVRNGAERTDKIGIIKRFADRWEATRRQEPTEIGGHTPTHAALLRFVPDLIQRNEARKIALVITDGEPTDQEATVTLFRECRTAGVDMATIFLGSHGTTHERSLAQCGFYVARVSDPTDAKATATALEKALRGIFLEHCGTPPRMAA